MNEQPALFPSLARAEGQGAIEQAAARTIEALKKTGLLDASHSLKVELIMQGSRQLDHEFTRSKTSIAAIQLFTKVIDVADGLPTVQEAIDDSFSSLVAALEQA